MVKRIALFGLTGISLYLLAPTLIEVFGSYDELTKISPGWLLVMVLLQVLSYSCLWVLQAMALNTRDWYAVVWSQLAGNSFSRVVPGGGAAGAALQYRLVRQAGVPTGLAATGLTASNVLVFAVLLALPVFAIPSLLHGVHIDQSLARSAVVGAAILVLMFSVGVVLLVFDRPLYLLGRGIQRTHNRLLRRRPPRTKVPERLFQERSLILRVMGRHWWEALLAAIGRWIFDYATLLAALAAIGARPPAAGVLLAFTAAQILAQVPLTPGGLGFVEAGMTGTLALIGVTGGGAVLCTLAYRIVSFWLPIPFGALGAFLMRRRYGEAPEDDEEEQRQTPPPAPQVA